jgi:putative ABC transport system permease protein
MIRNYLKSSIRHLLKNPLASFINVFGLAAAIGTTMLAYAYLSLELTYEGQHMNKDRLFMVTSKVDRDGKADVFGIAPQPLAKVMKSDFPQVEYASRIEKRNVVVKRGDNVFHETIRMADPDYLNMFTLDLYNEKFDAIKDMSSVVIHPQIAEKYFGNENPLGQSLDFQFKGGKKVTLKVVEIANSSEMETSFGFDFLVNFELLGLVDPDYRETNWSENISAAFIMTHKPEDLAVIQEKAKQYADVVNSAQKDWHVLDFGFEPLSTLYDHSRSIRWGISRQSDPDGQVVLVIIGILMLVLACLNYLNIAISSSTKRLKEIGVRKVIGANRLRLITQFIIENLLLSLIALVTGLFLAVYVFLPGFSSLFPVNMEINFLEPEFYFYLGGLLIATAIASGAYPAVYISSFQTVSIFRGKVQFGRKNPITKIFLSLQFVIACLTVACGIYFTLNSKYQERRDWGYDQKQGIMVQLSEEDQFETFKNALANDPDIERISGASHHLGARRASSVIDLPERKVEVGRMDVDAGYVETMNLRIKEGRSFNANSVADESNVIVNEAFVAALDWGNPIGESFRLDSVNYRVIGVVHDFHYWNFWNEISPLMIRLKKSENQTNFLVLRAKEGKTHQVFDRVESKWSSMFPDVPFEGDYQAQLFKGYFNNLKGHGVLMSTVATLALMLSCFGLFGLVSLNVASRLKEFSIRKVLGADLVHITRAVVSHFMNYLLIALIIAGPLSYFTIVKFFGVIYTYHMPLTVYPTVVAVASVLLTVGLTVGTQLNRINRSNPTDGLRIE